MTWLERENRCMERRAGEMMKAARAAGELAAVGVRKSNIPDGNILTLSDIDIAPKQSAAWTDLAELDKDDFEARVEKVAAAI